MVVTLRNTELGYSEEQVVAVRLGALQNLCTTRGIRPMTEKEITDNIEKFELGNNIINCYPNNQKLVKVEYTFNSFYLGLRRPLCQYIDNHNSLCLFHKGLLL